MTVTHEIYLHLKEHVYKTTILYMYTDLFMR